MDRIIIHWTAGGPTPNNVDLKHYHFLIDQRGVINHGIFKPEDNFCCTDGKYAAHTGGGNTRSIGVSLCGMYSFVNRNNVGNYPLTKIQCEAAFKLVAQLANKYKIPVDENHVMTHYEFGRKHPNTTSYGKIDIIYLPPYSQIKQNDVGNFIRSKVKWYQSHL